MDAQKMMEEMQRQDAAAPLQGFSLPKIDIEKIKENLELPDKFLRTCTLREGTLIVVLFLNSVAVLLIAYLAMLLLAYPDDTTAWWKERFRDDFDHYYHDENQEFRDKLVPLWVPFSYGIIGAKALYFFTGCLVLYALRKKTVHPCWYMPWLMVSAILVAVMWLMSFAMIIVLFILLGYRPITVTWDIGPIACVIAYSVAWSYAFFVVVAHYQRRCIVKYWRDRQQMMGTDSFGPQRGEY